MVAEFPRVFVVGAYVPNSGAELKRLAPRTNAWDPAMARYLRALEAKKPVVYCGDLNVAAREIDLWGNHRANQTSAGFTPQGGRAHEHYVGDVGVRHEEGQPKPFVDTFRAAHPGPGALGFSYRRARGANRGADRLRARETPRELVVHDAYIRGRGGSDHCPVGAVFRLVEGGTRRRREERLLLHVQIAKKKKKKLADESSGAYLSACARIDADEIRTRAGNAHSPAGIPQPFSFQGGESHGQARF